MYTLNDLQTFDAQHSITVSAEVITNGVVDFELPSMPSKLHLDVDVSSITLTKLSIDKNKPGLSLIDGQAEAWQRTLGYIPLIWANQDGNDMYGKAPLLSQSLDLKEAEWSTQSVSKTEQPAYLVLDISSDIAQSASVSLLDSKDESMLGLFSFYIPQDKHTYAIRLSTDYKFWNGNVGLLNLVALRM